MKRGLFAANRIRALEARIEELEDKLEEIEESRVDAVRILTIILEHWHDGAVVVPADLLQSFVSSGAIVAWRNRTTGDLHLTVRRDVHRPDEERRH